MKSRNFEKVEKVGYEISNLVHTFCLNWRNELLFNWVTSNKILPFGEQQLFFSFCVVVFRNREGFF